MVDWRWTFCGRTQAVERNKVQRQLWNLFPHSAIRVSMELLITICCPNFLPDSGGHLSFKTSFQYLVALSADFSFLPSAGWWVMWFVTENFKAPSWNLTFRATTPKKVEIFFPLLCLWVLCPPSSLHAGHEFRRFHPSRPPNSDSSFWASNLVRIRANSTSLTKSISKISQPIVYGYIDIFNWLLCMHGIPTLSNSNIQAA